MKRKGWFVIPGIQDGERPLEVQVKALRPAIADAKGKTVLDMGCAEGLIALEFARAGATVRAFDSIQGNIDVAARLRQREPVAIQGALQLEVCEVTAFINASEPERQYDIVLALGILHKMADPAIGAAFVARATRDLLLMRSGRAQERGIITSKFAAKRSVDAHAVLREAGFELEKMLEGPGPWHENVEYWRRVR